MSVAMEYAFVGACLLSGLSALAQPLPRADSVTAIVRKVNDHWQSTHPDHGQAFWDNAAYHTGNMEAYFLTKNDAYRQYSEAWATQNEWKGAKSDDKANWKYSYGETDEYVLFGDWQICFQTYIDLYKLKPEPYKIARAKAVMSYEMSTPRTDYWWWADGLYMVMPVMTKLYTLTGNQQYLDKLHDYFTYAKRWLFFCFHNGGIPALCHPYSRSANGRTDKVGHFGN